MCSASSASIAVLFAVRHLDPVRFPALVLLGIVFGWAAWRSGSLWPAVAAHAACNGVAIALARSPHAHLAGAATDLRSEGVIWLLAAGAAALAVPAALLCWATPRPPPVGDAVALRDLRRPSTHFRLEHLPVALVRIALLGAVALGVLVLRSPWWERAFGR